MPQLMTIKNRYLKMSPGGLITLPLSARKCLGMAPRQNAVVSVAVKDKQIAITSNVNTRQEASKVSPKGMLELKGDAREVLAQGAKRHYWMDLDDANKIVYLHPYSE